MTALQPLLRQHDFRALLGARLTNGLAFSALATVVGFQVYEITRDPLALGLLGLVEAIPALSLVLFGGHVADRYDRRTIILVTSAAWRRRAPWPSPCCRATPALSLAPILAVIFVTGIASGFERPALTAFEAQVIPLEQAVQGVSYQASVSQTGVHHRTRAGWHRRGDHRRRRDLRPDRHPARDLDRVPVRDPAQADARARSKASR